MLTDEERTSIAALARKYDRPRAACLEALRVVQDRRGWVADEALREVAALLDMSPEELESVATGFSLIFRRPVGRHVILLCDSVTCWIEGYEAIREHLVTRLGIGFGQTTADGQWTLIPVACLGACDQAPAMMIDDRLYGHLTVERVDEILDGV
jgi:NADH-quinone oxidoreductase subunit E